MLNGLQHALAAVAVTAVAERPVDAEPGIAPPARETKSPECRVAGKLARQPTSGDVKTYFTQGTAADDPVLTKTQSGPFGGTIAHGYLTLSLLAALAIEIGLIPEDASAGLNYGLDKVRFMTPVKAGARVRNRATLISVEKKGGGRIVVKTMNELQIEGEEKPALIAETLAMLVL